MLMNITDTGYVMSWDVDKYPGQPTGDRFAFEKRKVNSSAWTNVPDSASGNTRQHVYVPQEKEAKDPMEFRMFAMKGKYKSEPVYPTRIVKTGTSIAAMLKNSRMSLRQRLLVNYYKLMLSFDYIDVRKCYC